MKMKNKKAEQIEKKKKHRENLKPKRRREPDLDRNEPILKVKPSILIVCEGENTEPSYFRQFRLSSADVIPIGEGYNTISLVNRAKELEGSSNQKYDQVWCVFDKDSSSPNDFNNAIVIANANGHKVAYSNQAFEYWILLHFDDHQGGGMDRKEYHNNINKHLKPFNLKYDGKGSKKITSEIYNILDGVDQKTGVARKMLAINRATRNYNRLNHSSPASEESSTTVFKLVEELLKYL